MSKCCPAAPASESTVSSGRSNHQLAWLVELNCSYNKITAGLAWCLYSSFNYTALFLIFGFWACLPKDLLVYLHCESLPSVWKAGMWCCPLDSQSWAMGWLHTKLHQQLVAVSCLMLFNANVHKITSPRISNCAHSICLYLHIVSKGMMGWPGLLPYKLTRWNCPFMS